MQIPAQVTFRDVPHSADIENLIQNKTRALERLCGRMTSCRVTIAAPHRHKRTSGSYYHVTVDLTLPGGEVVAAREPAQTASHDDLQTAIRDAFRTAKRQLRESVRRIRRDVKEAAIPPHARVVRIIPFEEYGFLETADGEEVYFHRSSVLNDAFDKLKVGDEVRFAGEQGDHGPRATTVIPTSRHLLSLHVTKPV